MPLGVAIVVSWKPDEALSDLHHAKPLGEASEAAKDKLRELRIVRMANADKWLHCVDDPATHLYIVDEGAVGLVESSSIEPVEVSGVQVF